MKPLFLPFIFILFAAKIHSQENTQLWLQYHLNKSINMKWYWHQDFNIRFQEKEPTVSTLAYRTGIGYKFSKKFKILIGTAYFEANPTLSSVKSEFRPYEEMLYSFSKNSKFRLRVEQRQTYVQRFLKTKNKNWIRYRLLLQKSFDLFTSNQNEYQFNLANEVFLNLYPKNNFSQDLDQNRFMLSLSKKKKSQKIELLYNHNIINFDSFKNFYPIFLIKMVQDI